MTCFPARKLEGWLHIAICTMKIRLEELVVDHWVAHLSFLLGGCKTPGLESSKAG